MFLYKICTIYFFNFISSRKQKKRIWIWILELERPKTNRFDTYTHAIKLHIEKENKKNQNDNKSHQHKNDMMKKERIFTMKKKNKKKYNNRNKYKFFLSFYQLVILGFFFICSNLFKSVLTFLVFYFKMMIFKINYYYSMIRTKRKREFVRNAQHGSHRNCVCNNLTPQSMRRQSILRVFEQTKIV